MTVTALPSVSTSCPSFARWWFDEAPPIGPSTANHHERVDTVLSEAACADTLEEAVRHVVHTLTGSDVHTVIASLERMVVFRVGEAISWVRWTPDSDRQWHDVTRLWAPRLAPDQRATLLRLVLNADSYSSSHDAQQTLSAPWAGLAWKPLVAAGALSMWWQDQMAQGRTPEAARMMLSLLLPADALAKVHLDTDGQTPVYTGLPSEVYAGHITTYHPCPRTGTVSR